MSFAVVRLWIVKFRLTPFASYPITCVLEACCDVSLEALGLGPVTHMGF
jgi:hypothetical protein